MRSRPLLLLLGIVLVAVNLRLALTSVGPVIDDLRHDLHLSSAAAGLLTTAPLLALGLVAPLAPRLADRFGAERVVLGCLLAIALGSLLRLPSPFGTLFAGSLVAGCAIAIANVLLPGIVKRRFPERAAFLTGIYSLALTGGAAIAAGFTVPLEHGLGGWRLALAAWGLPALIAGLVWVPHLREAGREAAADVGAARPRERVRLWRDRRAWQVALLMGLQSLLFYSTVAWMADVLRSDGLSSGSAGALLSVSMLMGIPSGLAISVAAGRMHDQRPLAVIAAGTTALGFVGLLVAGSTAPAVWAVILGIGQGCGFTLTLTLFVLRARDAVHAAELSSMAQAIGYTLAALGPFAIGALHDMSGSWTLPLAVLAGLTVPELIVALGASRPGYVGAPVAEPEAVASPAAAVR